MKDMKDSDRDFLAVQEDALLVDILATREDLSAFADDHIAQVLGSYAADVDEGLELLVNAQLPEAPRQLSQHQSAASSRRSARFLVAATTAVVLVGTSGVAAAVTGDPLSPFRSVVKAVSGGGQTPSADPGRISEELPDPASTKAEVALTLNDVKEALRDGDVEKAQRLLDELAADMQGGVELSPGLEARIDKMQDEVDKSANGQGGQGGQDSEKPGQGVPQDDKPKHDNEGNTSHPNKPGQADDKPSKPGQDTKDPNDPNDKGSGASNGGTDGSKPGSGSSKDSTTKNGDGKDNDDGSGGRQDDTTAGGKPAGSQSGGQVKGRPDRGPDKADKADKPEKPDHGSKAGQSKSGE